MSTIHTGTVVFYNVGRQYGFIRDNDTGKEYFCHNDSLIDHIKMKDKVVFELVDNPKGAVASNVRLNININTEKDNENDYRTE